MDLDKIENKLKVTHTGTMHKQIQLTLATLLESNPEIKYVDVEHQIRSPIGYWPADVYFRNFDGDIGIIEVETGREDTERKKVLRKFYTFLSLEEKKDYLYFAYPVYSKPPLDEISYLSNKLNVEVPYVYRVSEGDLTTKYSLCIPVKRIAGKGITKMCVNSIEVKGGFNIF